MHLHRDISHTDMLQPYFISFRGVSGAGGNMSESRNFCQFYLVLSLFYSLNRGSNGFIAEKTILILNKGSRGGPLFSGGGGGGLSNFFQGGGGPNANFYIETHIRTFIYQGECPDPLSPLDPHMGNVIIRDNIYHSPASNHNCQALICQEFMTGEVFHMIH